MLRFNSRVAHLRRDLRGRIGLGYVEREGREGLTQVWNEPSDAGCCELYVVCAVQASAQVCGV